MEVSRIRVLRGPNLWSRHTAIEAIVHCTPSECGIDDLPGYETRLRARFPEIASLHATGSDSAVPIAHVLELAALGLQAHAGCPVTFSRTVATTVSGDYQVVVEFTEEQVGRLAFDLAQTLCLAALHDAPFELDDALKQLHDLDQDLRLGPSTGAIVHAAEARGIPYRRLTSGSMVQFGWGSKQRRILAAETDRTGAVAEAIAQDKMLTKQLLDAAGVPVPLGRPVTDVDDAWAAALEVGLPVVVKPQDGNQGKGVTVNVVAREHMQIAYNAAAAISSDVMIERYLPGNDYRLLVIGERLIAAARRDPPHVIGDGKHTIQDLVDQVNSDPRRGEGHATSLTKIRIDKIAIARLELQGFTVDSVPTKGKLVVLRNNANLSTGGTATDVTDDVHPEVAARAVEAARMVGLDICGVDVVCESMLQPLEKQNGGIVEVNAAPGLRMHLQPSFGKSRPVGEAIISSMFGDHENGRIPLVAVAGTNGKTTTVRLISHLITTSGLRVGMTNSDGVYIEGKRIDSGDCSGPKSARNVLMHPGVDAAVLETARGGLLREGLAFDRCDVAVVTNMGAGDHLGLNYISTVEDLAVLKRVVVENVTPKRGIAVLNAADPIVAKMAKVCPGTVTFFASDANHPVMATHKARGRRVVYVDAGAIVTAEGQFTHRYLFADIPLTRNGMIGFQIENAMAAIAAGWALGLNPEIIRKGLATFVNDAATAPGRFNMFNYRGAQIIADYGHNPDAIFALVKAVENIPAQRRLVVISGAGDRRDQDIRQQTEILGDSFDEVIMYQDQCQRGRSDGEVLMLLRQGLQNAKRTKHTQEINGEFAAIDVALARVRENDVCLVLIDQVDEALAHIEKRVKAG
jgi:cyanophycin synthetase